MENEGYAVTQRLEQTYDAQLTEIQGALDLFFQTMRSSNEDIQTSELASATMMLDQEDRLLHPEFVPEAPMQTVEAPVDWGMTQDLEFQDRNYSEAAALYQQIADSVESPNWKMRCRLAGANCLIKSGQPEKGKEQLWQILRSPNMREAIGESGRPLFPNVALKIAKLSQGENHMEYTEAIGMLVSMLDKTGNIPSAQRLFLMRELERLSESLRRPEWEREMMALEHFFSLEEEHLNNALTETSMDGVWCYATTQGQVHTLFHESTIQRKLDQLIHDGIHIPGLKIDLVKPGRSFHQNDFVPARSANGALPGWTIVSQFTGENPFLANASRQRRRYLWAGTLTLIIVVGLAALTGKTLNDQIRLARLKDELVSTVSHELRTPLATMRSLVETLADDKISDEAAKKDYLKMIDQENVRLSHLIDNFLAYSRMEQGKRPFAFTPIAPAELIHDATSALGERLSSSDCNFVQEIAHPLPQIKGDYDALLTVLINLLDNALKYSPGSKEIFLRVSHSDVQLRVEIEDRGIGIDEVSIKSIFDRFYQADQGLTREQSGCGLGLSIVRYIVEGHHGSISVRSKLGTGSSFTVLLPCSKSVHQQFVTNVS